MFTKCFRDKKINIAFLKPKYSICKHKFCIYFECIAYFPTQDSVLKFKKLQYYDYLEEFVLIFMFS